LVAVDAFRKAMGLRPDFAKGHLGLALALKAMGDMSAATKALEEGLAVCSNDATLTEELQRISLRLLIAPDVGGSSARPWTCCVCFDEKPATDTVHVAICTGSPAECTFFFCSTCLEGHFQSQLGGSSGMPALPPVRCPAPSCNRRVPTESWTKFVPVSAMQSYQRSAADILNFRCRNCDNTGTLFLTGQEGDELASDETEILTGVDKCAYMEIISGRIGEGRFLELREKMLSFEAGACEADAMVDALALAFDKGADEIAGDKSDQEVTQFLMLLGDVERRCVLQLACLRRNPKIITPCCGDQYCWKCKIGSHHTGRTCEEVQRDQYDQEVQFCPGCNVATLRTEGCQEIVCVCGEIWTWEGDDDSDY